LMQIGDVLAVPCLQDLYCFHMFNRVFHIYSL
jgi:hypothetical protein